MEREKQFKQNRLHQLRTDRGLSLRKLAEEVGVDWSTLSFCEKGQRNFSARVIAALTKYFGVSADYLLGNKTGVSNCRLKELREANGLTIRELSTLTKISHSQLGRIESGERKISTPQAAALADFFGITVDALLGRTAEDDSLIEPEITDEEVEKRFFKVTKLGYKMVYLPESKMAGKNGWVFLHRIVVAKSIGRDLTPEEVVHHIDGDPSNNALSNLMLFPNNAEHRRYHGQQRRNQMIDDLLKK